VLNLSVHPITIDGEDDAGDLAFYRRGRKVASLHVLAGPPAQLATFIEGGGELSEAHRHWRWRPKRLAAQSATMRVAKGPAWATTARKSLTRAFSVAELTLAAAYMQDALATHRS
jgi:hypothetical protein